MKILQKLKSWLCTKNESLKIDENKDYIETCVERYGESLQNDPYYAVYYKLCPKDKWHIIEKNFIWKNWSGQWDLDAIVKSDKHFPLLLKKQEAIETAQNLTRESLKKMQDDKEREWSEYIKTREEHLKKIAEDNPKFIKVK